MIGKDAHLFILEIWVTGHTIPEFVRWQTYKPLLLKFSLMNNIRDSSVSLQTAEFQLAKSVGWPIKASATLSLLKRIFFFVYLILQVTKLPQNEIEDCWWALPFGLCQGWGEAV